MFDLGRVCTRCKVEQPRSEFQEDSRYAGGIRTWCRRCYREEFADGDDTAEVKNIPEDHEIPDHLRAGPMVTEEEASDELRSIVEDALGEYKLENRERARALERRGKYGISLEDQAAMWVDQGGRCASCGALFQTTLETHMDHDHVTNRVRGFLCRPCNHTVGSSQESPVRLRACADYLELQEVRHREG